MPEPTESQRRIAERLVEMVYRVCMADSREEAVEAVIPLVIEADQDFE